MLPFSVDWFMTWLPNIHSSLFYNVYSFLNSRTASRGIRATIDAYRLYLEHAGVENQADEPVLSFTRAWMLVRFFDSGMLQLRSEEHTSELQSLMRISYAVFCLKKQNKQHMLSMTTIQYK